MYQIKCDDYILHDVRIDNLQVVSPKCSLQLRKTGMLTFRLPPAHPYYNNVKKHVSEIVLYQDDAVLFSGRVLNDEIDFLNIKNVECEGELSYFLDSIQRGKEYHLNGGSANVIDTYLKDLVSIHNSQVDNRKKFTVGTVTVADPNNYLYKISNFNDTLSCLNDKLINTYGGYFKIRYSEGVRYIDYLKELNETCNQRIEFGKNIIDLKKHIKGEDIFTALIPLGAKIEDEEDEEEDEEDTPKEKFDKRVDIKGVADSTSGTIKKVGDYIYDTEAVKKWGWIWKPEKWDDVEDAQNLFTKAKELLKTSINETLTIELTAIDLHLLDVDIDKISLGDKVQVVSIPHNLNEIMIVEKIDIDIDNPQNTKITLTLPENFISKDTSISNTKNTSDKKIQEVKELVRDGVITQKDIDALDTKYINVSNDIKSVDQLKDWTDNYHIKTTPAETIKSVGEMKDWTSSNHLKTVPGDSIKSVSDMQKWVGDNYDLSQYAKIVDVNNAFNELASALGGV